MYQKRFLLSLNSGMILYLSVLVFCSMWLPERAMGQTDVSEEEIAFFREKGMQPFLAAEQDGDYPSGTYLVLKDLVIEQGKVMTLYPGSMIFLKKDARIIVKGKLVCQGKPEARVIFEKLDNYSYFNPIDTSIGTWWDGLYVEDSATLEMSFTEVNSSKYGIIAKPNAASLALDSIQFYNNKYHSIRFGSEIPDVPDNEMITIRRSGLDNQPTVRAQNENSSSPIPKASYSSVYRNQMTDGTTLMKTNPPQRNKLRIVSTISTLVGAALAGGGYYVFDYYNDLSKNHSNPEVDKPETIDKYERLRLIGEISTYTGIGIGVLGLTGFTLSFVF